MENDERPLAYIPPAKPKRKSIYIPADDEYVPAEPSQIGEENFPSLGIIVELEKDEADIDKGKGR